MGRERRGFTKNKGREKKRGCQCEGKYRTHRGAGGDERLFLVA